MMKLLFSLLFCSALAAVDHPDWVQQLSKLAFEVPGQPAHRPVRGIVLGSFDESFVHLAINSACAYRLAGFIGFAFHAMTPTAMERVLQLDPTMAPHVFYTDVASSTYGTWGDATYRSATCKRLVLFAPLLRAGITVINSGMDVIYLKNPYTVRPVVRALAAGVDIMLGNDLLNHRWSTMSPGSADPDHERGGHGRWHAGSDRHHARGRMMVQTPDNSEDASVCSSPAAYYGKDSTKAAAIAKSVAENAERRKRARGEGDAADDSDVVHEGMSEYNCACASTWTCRDGVNGDTYLLRGTTDVADSMAEVAAACTRTRLTPTTVLPPNVFPSGLGGFFRGTDQAALQLLPPAQRYPLPAIKGASALQVEGDRISDVWWDVGFDDMASVRARVWKNLSTTCMPSCAFPGMVMKTDKALRNAQATMITSVHFNGFDTRAKLSRMIEEDLWLLGSCPALGGPATTRVEARPAKVWWGGRYGNGTASALPTAQQRQHGQADGGTDVDYDPRGGRDGKVNGTWWEQCFRRQACRASLKQKWTTTEGLTNDHCDTIAEKAWFGYGQQHLREYNYVSHSLMGKCPR